jgi:hypothetical protein
MCRAVDPAGHRMTELRKPWYAEFWMSTEYISYGDARGEWPTSSSGTLMCKLRKAPECPMLSTLSAPRTATECDHVESHHKTSFRHFVEVSMGSLKQAVDDRGEKEFIWMLYSRTRT